jgi:uncharacterized membrane protein
LGFALKLHQGPRVRWSNKLLIGGLFAGWGTFNVVEGIVHHPLRIHHARSGPDELLYDLGFLAWGRSCSPQASCLCGQEPRKPSLSQAGVDK